MLHSLPLAQAEALVRADLVEHHIFINMVLLVVAVAGMVVALTKGNRIAILPVHITMEVDLDM